MYHTAGLILKKGEWKEADLLITALTRDFGKIRLMAQGARKHGAKLQSHIEPGSLSELSFVVGRNGYRLTTAQVREPFISLRNSLSKTRALYSILTLVDANLLEERDGAGVLFDIVRETLAAIGRVHEAADVKNILIWGQVKFLEFLGFLPSPHSPEAVHCRSLLALASVALDQVKDFSSGKPAWVREMSWLAGYLDNVVWIPSAVNGAQSAV